MRRGEKRIYGGARVEHRGNRKTMGDEGIKRRGITGVTKEDTDRRKMRKDKIVKIK